MHVHHASCLRVELHPINLQQLSHTLNFAQWLLQTLWIVSLVMHEYPKFLKMHRKDHQLHEGLQFSASIDQFDSH